MGGSVVPEFDLRVVMRKALTIRGSTLRARPLAYKADLVARFWTPERVAKYESGGLQSQIHSESDLASVGQCHAMMESNQNTGKIVVCVDRSLQ